ncbi:MAG: response regulator [Nitrospirae bacterium]|nr:response regulator [Nitrospirota bacterium]
MRKPRAIVCDDEAIILDMFRTVLERMGYEVLTAATPMTCSYYREHAESCPQHNRCADILITDHRMPAMTGLQLLEMQQKSGCKLSSRNKALITGNDLSELKLQTELLGCRFMLKPMRISAITEWVKECEKRFDLSEPLATDLYMPATGKQLCVLNSK